ncbi:MAG TPA: serine/threonine-protein kinase, partial [Polyangiaceae bacterium]|nr:serine/threonine-protein kinase [Polyangiaceae bacterium]
MNTASAQSRQDVGRVVDKRYRLRREIARGGAGAVFEAEHLFTTRSVAVKLLIGSSAYTPDARLRLLQEAQALTVARHPGIVQALDAGETEDGSPYLVMELLEGRPLDGILTVRRLNVSEAVAVGTQLCGALAAAHERGIVHRDLKPSNVFLAKNDAGREITKLFDFGVARIRGIDRKLTQEGALLGTPEYMAPEQLLAAGQDHRCDLYALGVTLFEALSGAVPFEGNFGQVLLKVSTEPVPSLRARCPDVPAQLASVIEKALARDPNERHADARSFAIAMNRAFPAPPSTSLLGLSQTSPVGTAQPAPMAGLPPPRRRFARAPYVTPVRMFRGDGTTLDGRSEDISIGGLLVLARPAFEKEERVKVRFALPISGRMIEVMGTARWTKAARASGAV